MMLLYVVIKSYAVYFENAMDTKQVRMIVSGVVQGVFFRASTQDKAQLLGLKGWVRNRHDGTVEICAQGFQPQLDDFVHWCRRGPDQAHVTNLEAINEDVTSIFESFDILATG